MSQAHAAILLPAPRFVSEKELGRQWRKSVRTLQRYRSEGTGPDFLKIGHSVFYRPEDIAAFEQGALRSKGSARG